MTKDTISYFDNNEVDLAEQLITKYKDAGYELIEATDNLFEFLYKMRIPDDDFKNNEQIASSTDLNSVYSFEKLLTNYLVFAPKIFTKE